MTDPFLEDISLDKFIRVDETHPIDWRYNISDPPTKLVLKTKKKPADFRETTGMHVSVIPQNSGYYAVIFVLNDPQCTDIFKKFCEDVVESSRDVDPDEATDYAFERYAKWMHLFKPFPNDKLSGKEIRGLIGEMYVLKSKFIPVFGALSSLKSWMGRLKGKQDFIEHDKWYEVKARLEGNETVHISSLEQLSRTDEGELVVVNLKKTSPVAEKRVTLNSLYSDIVDMLPTYALKRQFSEIMLASGFLVGDPYYDDYCYEIIDVIGYGVTDCFPRLTPENLPYKGIPSAKYEILVEAIRDFEVEKWN